jgi:hypothetical protein
MRSIDNTDGFLRSTLGAMFERFAVAFSALSTSFVVFTRVSR